MGSNPDNILFVFSENFLSSTSIVPGSKFGCRLYRHFFTEPAAGSLATSLIICSRKKTVEFSLSLEYKFICIFFQVVPSQVPANSK